MSNHSQTWEEFTSRFYGGFPSGNPDFYAVIDFSGNWVDSSTQFETAVYWAVMDSGTNDEELSLQENLHKIDRAGYSIVHARLLKTLFEAGLVR